MLMPRFQLDARAPRALARQLRARAAKHGLADFDAPQFKTVHDIVHDVRARGDAALVEYSRSLDQADLTPDTFRVSADEMARAHESLPADLLCAIRHAARRILDYQQAILGPADHIHNRDGLSITTRSIPLNACGCMVPAASAPLPSSLLHTALCARAAGVSRIAVFSPPRHHRTVHPVIAAAAHEIGISELYRIGGAHAVAAAAFGTESIAPVEKIVGPGNVFVALAKRLVYGNVDIDSFAGASEVLILADGTADPRFLAADLLAQAEHAPGMAVLVCCASEDLPERVEQELARQLKDLPRADHARACLADLGAIIVADDLPAAIELTHYFAPEHLEIHTVQPDLVASQCPTAGAIFLGPYTPEAIGDYIAGPSHVLPTAGTSRHFSGLSSLSFIRKQAVVRASQQGIGLLGRHAATIARAEGLDAHARSCDRSV